MSSTTRPPYDVRRYATVSLLPDEWDGLAEMHFQKKSFLLHLEKFNPCRQRYYLVFRGNKACAAAVLYTQPVNLFTFSNIRSPLRMQIIGIPASVSPPGLFGDREGLATLLDHVFREERGLILALNISPITETGKGIRMRMLPTLELDRNFASVEDYLNQLRSPYRRRYRKVVNNRKEMKIIQSSCAGFSDQHYRLYKEVHRRSKTKLELLQQPFFETLPGNFSLTTYYRGSEMLSWHISCRDRASDRFYFLFGGHDYRYNHAYDSYFNNLAGILTEGIENGYSTIDFGQTAEIPKMRLGAIPVPKDLFLYHRNPLLRFILNMTKGLLGYHRSIPVPHVFKQIHQPDKKFPDYEDSARSPQAVAGYDRPSAFDDR